MKELDCREVAERLHGFLDRERGDAEIAEVQAHLDNCEECHSKFRFEASLKRLVMVRSSEEGASSSLRKRIADRLKRER